ncbi:uncharacterized protein [Miscanthus floridulus]|uniref:uncharacterized protein n=1 Tax=Miscanthus floridulus TaxID=154761 RepID=UPI00345A9A93
MARSRVRGMPALALVVAAVAVACAEARLPDYHPPTFTVTGKVQCQDCTKNWNAYAYNAKPIPGSKVSITCRDTNNRVVHHSSDYTDGQGVFNIEVPRKAKNNDRDIEASRCLVRLASSGDAACAVFTDFNRGKTGQIPSRLTHASPNKETYAVGPYYCTLRQCDVKVKDADAGY